MHARYEIHLENYCNIKRIETLTLRDIAMRHIIPAVSAYTGDLADTLAKKKAVTGVSVRVEENLLLRLSRLNTAALDTCEALEKALAKAPCANGGIESALYYRKELDERMGKLRDTLNELEALTSDEYWPYPTYSDILFSV
jgi:glutamine synthetase